MTTSAKLLRVLTEGKSSDIEFWQLTRMERNERQQRSLNLLTSRISWRRKGGHWRGEERPSNKFRPERKSTGQAPQLKRSERAGKFFPPSSVGLESAQHLAGLCQRSVWSRNEGGQGFQMIFPAGKNGLLPMNKSIIKSSKTCMLTIGDAISFFKNV